jgi:Cu/Ag efflux pump CusA
VTVPESRTLMRWIVRSSLRFRFLVVAVAAAMMVFGTLQIQNMRVDAFPEFAPPRVEIQTICLGLSTSDVESLVTVPLEQALNGIKGLDDMRSKSVPQLSSIELIFKQGTDLLEARQLAQERLANVQNSLPTWASPPVMLPPLSATSRVMQIGMTSQEHSLIAMSMMAYWTIRARLLRVNGVANVAIWGERLQMMTVQVDPKAMQAHNVTLNSVMEATSDSVDSGLLKFSNASVIGTGGAVQNSGQQLGIRHVLPIVTPADLARVSVLAENGTPVRMGEVADVKEDHQPLIGDAVVGNGPGLLLVIEKLLGAIRWRSQKVSRRRSSPCSQAFRTSPSTPPSSGSPTSSRRPSTTSHRRYCSASCWSSSSSPSSFSSGGSL